MKVRVISAIIAIAIFIPIIWFGGYLFAGAMGILSILAYKEILDLKKSHNEIPVVVKVLGLISLLFIVLGNYSKDGLDVVNYPKIILPIILLLIPTIFYKKDKYNTNNALYLLGSVYLIGFVFNLLIIVESINVKLLIYLLAVAFVSDTFAYLIGCLIGKHKMCPKISPHKSWEGAIAGLIGGTVISMIIYVNLLSNFSFNGLLLTICLCVGGQLGDLVFSKIKRENNIKDYSNIMPGHGGVLDRIDSFSFVVLMYIVLRVIL